jgi:adenine-specific DNA-methyltransferase
MAKKRSYKKGKKKVETILHEEDSRTYIPTAEYEQVMREEDKTLIRIAIERRNRDLDPQLVWRGKDEQDLSDLVVQAPPIYIQEKVHPKVLIDDLLRESQAREPIEGPQQLDLFTDFNGIPEGVEKTEFYQHDANWTNRMILGDSLQVMASLVEREGLRGKVQCIYIDPPYGISFNSNFQWSTTNHDVKDGKPEHITREPEQVRAFRDTWKDGIHSYLSYLRDRISVAVDLLADSGCLFVQIGDENVHRVRSLLDEVLGEGNFVATISFQKTGYSSGEFIPNLFDHILFYAKDIGRLKYRKLFFEKSGSDDGFSSWDLASAGAGASTFEYEFQGEVFHPGYNRHWKTQIEGLDRASKADRLFKSTASLRYKRYLRDFPVSEYHNIWTDTIVGSFHEPRRYVVQTSPKVIQRCILMTTDPGDLVLDPTCGSGTTAYVAEQWGRRWITIDTSRVAIALARIRIIGARYPYYILLDSREGQLKEAEVSRRTPSETSTYDRLRQGFVYERVPHIMLSTISNNAEIDVIWDEFQKKLDPIRDQLNIVLGTSWEEWQVPTNEEDYWPQDAKNLHANWCEVRVARQKEIDASIAAKADYEYLYDKPYEDSRKVRVAGPFTVESLAPHRMVVVGADDELIDPQQKLEAGEAGFVAMILENLKTAGVQQAHKEDKINFVSLTPWPGYYICAEGRYLEGGKESGAQKRAAIFIGPEFGTVSRPDLVAAAREAGDADFDVLIACAFSYDAQSTEFDKLGRIPVIKARMNADLHMAEDLKTTGKGNLFVIFGEPDIEIQSADDEMIRVKINGVDVFDPSTGEVRSDSADGIACWFIDTDYNEESFFVRHAYFLGAIDPYQSLKTTLRAEINREAWETLHSDTSRSFEKPESGRIAVKVINHLGDEVMKVFRVY